MADDIPEPSHGADSPKGLDALYVPVMAPDQTQKVLQFQWMRMHPSTAISLCDDEDSPAVQVSRMVSTYQTAMVSPTTSVTSPFLRARGVGVDLCDLFDPPLLSQPASTPSLHESRTPVPKRMNAADVVQESPHADQIVHNLLDLAMAELENEGEANSFDLLDSLSSLTPDKLLEALPTHFVRGKINERIQEQSSNGAVSFVQLSLMAMALLSERAACESIGRYVLSTLAPALLSLAEPSSDELKALLPLLSRLAYALVSTCGLGKLSKEELLRLTSPSPQMPESQVMDELMLCISEAFYSAINSA